MSDSSLLLPSGTQLGEYTILHSLGQGGFGITYLATDATSGQKVVIKENLPEGIAIRISDYSLEVSSVNSSDAGKANFECAIKNFLNEAQTLSALSHPGIVKVLRAFAVFNTAYFVMPYVEGDSLDKYREKHGAPTEEWVCGTLRALLEALKYLHGKNLLHRDIKPANIMLSKEGAPILIDFGTARQLLSEKSQTVIESPGYTPVEQMQSHGKVGPWTDLYALGATMYKLITGDTPPKNVDRMGKYDSCTPLSKRSDLKQSYSEQLLAGIDKAMSVWPEDRWSNAEEWLSRLSPPATSDSIGETHESKLTLQRQIALLEERNKQMDEKIRKQEESKKKKRTVLGTPLGISMKHDGAVYSVSYSPDGSKIVSGSRDRTIRIWDAETGQELKRMKLGRWWAWVSSVNFSPDGSKVVSGSCDATLRIWDAETGQELKRMKLGKWWAWVYSVSFSPDGRKIVSGAWDKTICIWDAETGQELKRMMHDSAVYSVSFSPDGSKIVSGSQDKTIRIWDAETGQELKRMKLDEQMAWANSVSFSPDGSMIVSGAEDSTLRIWDVETGQELMRMKHDYCVNSGSFSPDGSKIVSGSRDKIIRIWKGE